MQDFEPSQPSSHRRRSERIEQSLPLSVRGVDVLSQPFEEHTSTLVVNLHGCRYSSKHHVSKNSWVTLEIWDGLALRSVRARVAWVERPHSIRDFFQTAVELESPGNIWGLLNPPLDWVENWQGHAQSAMPQEAGPPPEDFAVTAAPYSEPPIPGTIEANPMGQAGSEYSSSFSPESGFQPAEASPLLRDLSAEIQRQVERAMEAAAAQTAENIRRAVEEDEQRRASTAGEFFQRWKEDFDRTQSNAREEFSAQLSAKQEEFLNGLRLQFEERFAEARQVLQDLEWQTRTARETEDSLRQANRIEQPVSSPREEDSREPAAGLWRERLESELSQAQAQWNELLQSSLDGSVERLARQLSERSQDVIRYAEDRIANRFAELRQPMAEVSAEARHSLATLRSELEHEMTLARGSLAEIEQVAARLKEFSGELEASSHNTLGEIQRRLEGILDSQTQRMNRHAEDLVAGMSSGLSPAIDSLGAQLVANTIAEVEVRLTPHLQRVPDLIRDLSSREMQVEETLRLHRERLRQLSESQHRDVAAQMADTVGHLRGDFELARQDALAKWNEELSATGIRAAHSASESIGQASEWFQNEARARLQVAVEQSLETAKASCENLASESAQKLAEESARRAAEHVQELQRHIETASSDAAVSARSKLDEAAQAAAASFGQILKDIADGQVENFGTATRDVMRQRTEEFERSAEQVLGVAALNAQAALAGFRTQLDSEIERSAGEGRQRLSLELSSMLDRLASERSTWQQEWAADIQHLSDESAARHQERLETACDAWLVSSVRRLNEHGQNVIESLLRLTDQSLRDACLKVFEGVAELVRDRAPAPGGYSSFAQQAAGRDLPENQAPR